MDSGTIRQRFLAFFDERDHTHVPSSSLVPNDPNLLLTNAGMIQFKPYFLGEQTPPFARAMSVQKCVRAGGKHNDLEEVGRTARHLTFFEMLGNFSFGDYYKERACPWAWELFTDGFGLDPDRLWVSVYRTDDEAADIWASVDGVRPERIVRRGVDDNFWSMGVAGPCGPCSEIFYDLGDAYGEASQQGPEGNEDRYQEIWNLVFMENDCNAAIEPVAELPRKNIDTGAGLERLAMVLQGVDNVFDTDLLGALVAGVSNLTGVAYGAGGEQDVSLKILADHGRSLAFLVADGILPSNEERGYVLRRVIRRALRHARLLGCERPVMSEIAGHVVDLMGGFYPELADNRTLIEDVAAGEEERFGQTLRQGLGLLEGEIHKARSARAVTLSGDVAFKLHDTFGFPVDLTTEIAREADLDVDSDEFERLMSEQRERARAARASRAPATDEAMLAEVGASAGATEFLGYEHLTGAARVVALIEDAETVPVASEGHEVDVVLDRTVFYAEGGGQVGDRGEIRGPAARLQVAGTRRLAGALVGHRATVATGELRVGDEVELSVDAAFRRGAQRAHTATHILHWALRDRLGEHAKQAGSLVEPGRLRFDFSHHEALGPGRIEDISGELQARVMTDDGVRAYETSFDFARSIGALAFFGERYGDFVRVVEVGEYSKELCGGTHVARTGEIGVVVITSEGSVGANLRRVEALVGDEGLAHLNRRVAVLERAADLLRARPEEVDARVERLLETQRDMERRIAEIERRSAASDAAGLIESAVEVDGTRLVVARRDAGVDSLRSLAQTLRGRLGSGVIVLGAAGQGRANLVGAVTSDLVERGISARDLLAPGARLLGGGGGGKPDLAISGGPRSDRLEEAIEAVAGAARDALTR